MSGRKSSRAVNAQKKALEAAKEFQAQQERLLGLAEEFFKLEDSSGVGDIDQRIADYEAKIEQLRVDRVQAQKASEVEQGQIVARFKGEGVSVAEIASRLTLSAVEVRRLAKLAVDKQETEDAA